MVKLKGNVGIGHVRYPTAGADSAHDAQPFYVNSPYGICLGHNGNLTNARELTEVLVREDRRHLNTGSDSEVLLNVLASELQRVGTPRVTPADIFAAANAVYRRCRGGYAVVAMVIGHGILGLPRSERHSAAGHRQARHQEGPRVDAGLRERRARHAGLRHGARRGARRGGVHRRAGAILCAAMRRDGAPHAVHLRVRVFRPARLDHRQHLGVQGAPAHGRAARREDQARAPRSRHRRGDSDPGHQPHQRGAGRAAPRRQVPGGLHQEPLHRPHLHHAGPGAALEIGAQQTERHRSGVSRQDGAAGGRLDRARHHLGADHRHGPRSRRQEGVFRLRRAAGALSECLRHRHAGRLGAGGRGTHRRRGARHHRRRLADLPGLGRSGARGPP